VRFAEPGSGEGVIRRFTRRGPGKRSQGVNDSLHGIRENPMKVSIIGGGGLVGSSAAYALQCGGVVSHICLIDANKDAALGHATELLHGSCVTSDQRITAGYMSDVATSNIVVITAGLRRKPDESR